MSIIKKVIKKVYHYYLRQHWNLESGLWLLEENYFSDYQSRKLPVSKIYSIHRKGFTVTDWCAMGLEEKDYRKYISSVQYYGLHPLNRSYSKWIDDKLTLKYLCMGTVLEKYTPEYYYLIDENGSILPLTDLAGNQLQNKKCNIKSVTYLLKEKGSLAVKMIAGSIGKGFYCAEYKEDSYFLNGKEMSRQEFEDEISQLRNYLIIEYLRPHKDLASLSMGSASCLRYLAGRVNGELTFLKSFIRFGTRASGFVENYGVGGVLCYVDENGHYDHGNILLNNKNTRIQQHPDNGGVLKGDIPMWDEITEVVEKFGNYFPELNYLGFDFVITNDSEIKILEINSLTSLDALQIEESLLDTTAAQFYKNYLN